MPGPVRERLRSAASGAIGSTFDFGVMIAAVEVLALGYGPAAALAAVAGATVCFLLNRRFAFRDRRRVTVRQLGAFAFMAAGSAALNAGAVHLMAGVLRIAYLLARAISAALVFLCWSYPLQARVIFVRHRSTQSGVES